MAYPRDRGRYGRAGVKTLSKRLARRGHLGLGGEEFAVLLGSKSEDAMESRTKMLPRRNGPQAIAHDAIRHRELHRKTCLSHALNAALEIIGIFIWQGAPLSLN